LLPDRLHERRGGADHERLVKDFDEATNAITAEVLAEEIILEAL
jgi:hypothetical protein